MLAKSSSFTVDSIIYDLEDSVHESKTKSALQNLCYFLSSPQAPPASAVPEIAIRIPKDYDEKKYFMSLGDLPGWSHASSPTFILPKIESPDDVSRAVGIASSALPRKAFQQLNFVLLIESPEAIMSIREILRVSPESVNGVIFGAEDFAAKAGLTRTDDLIEFAYARSALVTAARAAGIESIIDLVTLEHGLSDHDRAKLHHEARNGSNFGFTGKQIIHPHQIHTTQLAFSPSKESIEWAVEVVNGWLRAAEGDQGGSFSLNGKMMDRPMVLRARKIISRAKLCGAETPHLHADSSVLLENSDPERLPSH